MPEKVEAPDKGSGGDSSTSTVPNLQIKEYGFLGNVLSTDIHFDKCKRELMWPFAGRTYREMSQDSTIHPALFTLEAKVAGVPWVVKIPNGYQEDQELKKRAEYTRQIMQDMEHSWTQFVRQASTHNTYGFQVTEKVWRRRLHSKGSKFNDGLWGIRKLSARPQDTIVDWGFEANGRDIKYVVQSGYLPTAKIESKFSDLYGNHNKLFGQTIKIPKQKFMLFRNHGPTDTPWGYSPLAAVHTDWKYLKALKENEALGISQDLRGMKVLTIPPQYLSEEASDGDKEVFEYYQSAMNAMNRGLQSGLILPGIRDDSGEAMFKLELLSVQGKAGYDVDKVIQRYTVSILTCLNANYLSLGNTGGGSYALSDNLMSVSDEVVQSRLVEIRDILNKDLLPQLFKANGWPTDVMPYFDFGSIKKVDPDTFTKGIQRIAATGCLYKSAENVNHIASELGLPGMIDENLSPEQVAELLTPITSRSGDGMASGTNNGTSKQTSGRDNSAANNEN